MPTVPKYEPNVRLAPLVQQGFSVRASGDDFGAAIGRGMGDVASGLNKAAQAAVFVKELEGEAEAKQADNAYAAWEREAMYGQNGYMNLEGQAAVAARAEFEKTAAQKRQEFGGTLTGFGSKAYERASTARLNSILDRTITHQASERKTWMKQASADRVATFAEDALAGYQDSALVEKNINAGLAEIRSMAALSGLDEDSVTLREEQFRSGVHKNIALRLAQTDPSAAKAYADEHKASISGDDMTDLEGIFAPIILDQQARVAADQYLNPSAPSPTQFAATDLPPQAYGLLGVIAGSESPGYDVINGGDRFTAYDAHPNMKGAGGSSTAAGRYQFVFGTWTRVSKATGAADFTPENQDKGAWWLAQADYKTNTGRDLSADIAAGNYSQIKAGLGSTWEGLAKMSDEEFAKRMRMGGGAGAPMDPLAYLDSIENPDLRDATERRIAAVSAMRERMATERRATLKAEAFGYIDQGNAPDSMPPEMRAQLGREEMAGLWSYYEARSKGTPIKTDDETLYNLQRDYASDPEAFGLRFKNGDLWSARDKLSDSDWEKVTGWGQTALTDGRKTSDQATTIISTSEMMRTQLDQVGITTTGKTGRERDEAARREAEFQVALQREVDAATKANNGVALKPTEVQSIINRLLLPVVIKDPGTFYDSETNVRLFEVPNLGNVGGNKTAALYSDYAEIPQADRISIEMALEQRLGFKPSEEQVEAEYAAFLQAQYNTGQ